MHLPPFAVWVILYELSDDWDTRWSNTIVLPQQPRFFRDFYSLLHTESWSGCLCEPLPVPSFSKTHALHYPRCTWYIHRIFFPAVHLQPQKRRRDFFPQASEGRTLRIMPIFTTSFSAINAWPYPHHHALACPRERYEWAKRRVFR